MHFLLSYQCVISSFNLIHQLKLGKIFYQTSQKISDGFHEMMLMSLCKQICSTHVLQLVAI